MKKNTIVIITIITIIIMITLGISLFYRLVSLEEVSKSTILGLFVSLLVALFLEITNSELNQKKEISSFFWKQLVPYLENMEELFLYARDIYWIEELFLKYNVPKEEKNWQVYEKLYLQNKELLDQKIDGMVNEISKNGKKYTNLIATLSATLYNFKIKNIFLGFRKDYKRCYASYNVIENINVTLIEAYDFIQENKHAPEIERKCKEIIICRWIAGLYSTTEYIRIMDEELVEINDEENKLILAQKDLKNSIEEVMKCL